MPEVKWIKITTDMFEDEKIDFIESLPEADTLLVIWIKLLTMAGKCNSGGYIFLTDTIPYDEEMLAHRMRRPINIIKLALGTFQKLGMIQTNENGLLITNWAKYQNIQGLDTIREQNKLRQQRFRRNQKLLTDSNVTVTLNNAIEEERELEESNKIERFRIKGEDRRIEWYRIKPESLGKVEASIGRQDAIQFIKSFSNPVYSYKESKDGKKAIAAFMSMPLQEDERKNAQSKVDGAVSHFLKAVETLLHPGKDVKFAVVVMVRKGIKNEGAEP